MRYIGTQAHGIRLPIIKKGDALPGIVAESLVKAIGQERITLKETDVVGITEAIVAKAQGNFASVQDIGEDVRRKFGGRDIGLVFPITSRNRFLNILKGVAAGANSVNVLLKYPSDEVGNPIMDLDTLDETESLLKDPVEAAEFNRITGGFTHPFTNVDYIALYESAGSNIKVYLSKDPRDILKLNKKVLVGEIHSREATKRRLIKAGAETVYTLSDILAAPINGSGYNESYGVLGSNLSTENILKLFPRDCDAFVRSVREEIRKLTGISPEVLIYGDGAFKDPAAGIWELADPVVSPACTERLSGLPNEIKLKYVADNVLGNLNGEELGTAVADMIREKKERGVTFSEGTTPRKFADLLGSLCDLMTGSGDKGTPVVLIRGYFDDYASE